MNLEEIKKAKRNMELKINEAIKEFGSKTGLLPKSINLDIINYTTIRSREDEKVFMGVTTEVKI